MSQAVIEAGSAEGAPAPTRAEPLPLARRCAGGYGDLGGEALSREAIAGLDLGPAHRLGVLSPGVGATVDRLADARPGSLIVVEHESEASGVFARAAGRPGGRVVIAPPDRTGLDEASLSAVATNGLLTTLDARSREAVVDEVARVLRVGGRVALVELSGSAPAPLHPLAEAEWRGLLADAGLVTLGSVDAPVERPDPSALLRRLGPRGALALGRSLLAETSEAAALRNAVEVGSRTARARLILAERPLILGMCRPRG